MTSVPGILVVFCCQEIRYHRVDNAILIYIIPPLAAFVLAADI